MIPTRYPAQILNLTTILIATRTLVLPQVVVKPVEGIYAGGTFKFSFDVTSEYPMVPPKLNSLSTIYHPNIDLKGKVSLFCNLFFLL